MPSNESKARQSGYDTMSICAQKEAEWLGKKRTTVTSYRMKPSAT